MRSYERGTGAPENWLVSLPGAGAAFEVALAEVLRVCPGVGLMEPKAGRTGSPEDVPG